MKKYVLNGHVVALFKKTKLKLGIETVSVEVEVWEGSIDDLIWPKGPRHHWSMLLMEWKLDRVAAH